MKKFAFAMACATILSGCLAIPPRDTTPEMRDDYLAAVASVGCVMRSEKQYLPVELQAGLTREQAVALTEYHLASGKAEKLPGDQGVKLMTGACA
ncbi:hypothetical protein [Aquicoccus porphyridii]|uniref:hypothetical protein n=1 Tax=Aquicoccus porphyridii TaxID=1852029 RepID=UPI00273F7B9C|nr:hypothetical protein [Aquicoccus porphyridii]